MNRVGEESGKFRVFYYGEPVDTGVLLKALREARVLENRGRGGIKFLDVGEKKLVCRKYLHGGLFRALTKDLFMSDSRCRAEAHIMHTLARQGFPVAEAFCAISETAGPMKRLYLVTHLVENSKSLLDYLKESGSRVRLRTVRRFAQLLWDLERTGVYHPDLHLNNVLVTPRGELFFLDFDRARRKEITSADVEGMLWRLLRFTDKMEKQGKFRAEEREKILFVRTYERLSGHSIEKVMAQKMRRKNYIHRLGWFVEALLYGR